MIMGQRPQFLTRRPIPELDSLVVTGRRHVFPIRANLQGGDELVVPPEVRHALLEQACLAVPLPPPEIGLAGSWDVFIEKDADSPDITLFPGLRDLPEIDGVQQAFGS